MLTLQCLALSRYDYFLTQLEIKTCSFARSITEKVKSEKNLHFRAEQNNEKSEKMFPQNQNMQFGAEQNRESTVEKFKFH